MKLLGRGLRSSGNRTFEAIADPGLAARKDTSRSGFAGTALNLLFLLLLGASGIALTWLGLKLVLLSGSPWYLVMGAAMIITALLGARRNPWSINFYWIFLAANLIWALCECGLDGWALAPRLVMPICLGLWMIGATYCSWVGRERPVPWGRPVWYTLAFGLVIGCAALVWSAMLPAVTDPTPGPSPKTVAEGEWTKFGNEGGSRFSPLSQITPANVGSLQVAWTYHTGPAPKGARASLQTNPLMVNNRLFICTGSNDVIALDPETGKELWRFNARSDPRGIYGLTCRGVAYYRVADAKGTCAERVYTATVDARLIALDAVTGSLCRDFGQDGTVNLLAGMGEVEKGYYFVTSPPAVVRGKLVLGGWVTDGQRTGEPAGVIRAFDAVTGAFAWAFDPGRPTDHGMPANGESFVRGTPNSWAPMSSDETLGLVYVPTGNATPDYYGGHRTANDDRFSSAVIALDAQTGNARWVFQTTHHDLWDYDIASQPTLVDLPDGRHALIQPTKRGEIFVLDRATGRPLFPVTERAAPQGGVRGERLSPTQPYSTGMPSFGGPVPTEKGMWGLTPIDQAICRIRFKEARFDGAMTPLGLDRPTLTWPGYLGGSDWGGVAVDKKRGLLIVNNNQVANYNRLITRSQANKLGIHPMTAAHMNEVGGPAPQYGVPYAAMITPFLSNLAIPCQQPPYGRISAVDLRTGKLVWSKRFGTSRDSGPLGLPTLLPIPMGAPNVGAAVTTASGLTFIGATQEHAFRAFDTITGRELWRARLPAGGNSNPSTYWSPKSRRQFVVIPAGGHGAMLSGQSDALIAYALPADRE